MNRYSSKSRTAVSIWLVLIGITGCADSYLTMDPSFWRFPWDEKPDEVPGLVTPADRMAELQKLAQRGARAKSAKQEQVSTELAEAIRKEADPSIRAEIVRTLGEYPTATSRSVLLSALKDSDVDVRIAACKALAKRKDVEAINALAGVISSDVDVDVRLAAIRALGDTGDPAAVSALGIALEDPDPAMQYRAVASLRKLTGENLGQDVNRWREYVKGQRPKPAKPMSMAERFRQLF